MEPSTTAPGSMAAQRRRFARHLADGSRYEGHFDAGYEAATVCSRASRSATTATGPTTAARRWALRLQRRCDLHRHLVSGAAMALGVYAGPTVHYEGDWQNDLPDGFGRLDEVDHSTYEGGWSRANDRLRRDAVWRRLRL